MYNTSVQAIGKHKHIIFLHLTTAVDSTVCHNNNKTFFLQRLIRRMKFFCCEIWLNNSKKN